MLFINGLGADIPMLTTASSSQSSTSTIVSSRLRPASFSPTVRPGATTTQPSGFVAVTITPQFTCTASGCVAANEPTRNVFKAVQALIELVARKKGWTPSTWWTATPQTGVIDARTAANYLVIVNSGPPFGPLIEGRVDTRMVASMATVLANTMARWLGVPVPMPAPPPPPITVILPTPPAVTPPAAAPPAAAPPAAAPPAAAPPAAAPPAVTPPPPQELVPATPTPSEKPQAKYREGCVARFNKTRKIFSIYCPLETALGYAYYDNLAESQLTPSAEPAPAGMIKEGEEITVPTCTTKTGEVAPCPKTGDTERDKGFFRLHNPWMWVTLAGVVGVVGGTSYVVYRRRSPARSLSNQW